MAARAVDANRRMTDAIHDAGARDPGAAQPPRRAGLAGGAGRPPPGLRTQPHHLAVHGPRHREASARDIAGFVEAWALRRELAAPRRLRRRRDPHGARLSAAPVPRPLYNHRTDATAATSRAARGSRARCCGRCGRGWGRLHGRHPDRRRRAQPGGARRRRLPRRSRALREEARIDFLDHGGRRLPRRALGLPLLGDAGRVAARRGRRGEAGEPRHPRLRRRRATLGRGGRGGARAASPTWSR